LIPTEVGEADYISVMASDPGASIVRNGKSRLAFTGTNFSMIELLWC
jgi:hypothetical protein